MPAPMRRCRGCGAMAVCDAHGQCRACQPPVFEPRVETLDGGRLEQAPYVPSPDTIAATCLAIRSGKLRIKQRQHRKRGAP